MTSFANVLTGWTWIDPAEPERGGTFVFNKRLHQPGEQLVLGRAYAENNADQGRAVLADLAREPATAQHIAQKLARHFITDEPPPSLVANLAKTYQDTGSNLKSIAKALVTADEVLGAQAMLGESLWRPPAPNGWPDTEAAWIDGVPHRLDIANEVAGRLPNVDPGALLDSGLARLPPGIRARRSRAPKAERKPWRS